MAGQDRTGEWSMMMEEGRKGGMDGEVRKAEQVSRGGRYKERT